MRLAELEPRWVIPNHWARPDEFPFYIGVSFFCPHCPRDLPEHGMTRRRRLAVEFYPPIDSDKLIGRMFDWPDLGKHKRLAGETFETLTIEPSIGFDSIGHWHGRITAGAMLS